MIKIGFLLDDKLLKKWQHEIFKFIENHPGLSITGVFIKGVSTPITSNPGSFLYRFSQALDRKIFSIKNNVFTTVNTTQEIEKYSIYYINGIEKKYSYFFPEEDIGIIKEMEIDVLIRFGFGILKGEILNASRFGVWSLHHGDNSINRGGPPAFWEVVNGEPVTGVTLQRLSSNLDGGEVIRKAFIKTNRTSFIRNKNNIFWAGIELFNSALHDLSEGKLVLGLPDNEIEKEESKLFSPFYSYPLYKDPTNKISFKILLSFWIRRLNEIFQEKLRTPNWALYYSYSQQKGIEKSLFRYKKLNPPRGYDWADPFVVFDKGEYYLFFEELKINGKGHISVLVFDQTGKLKSPVPQKVLKENWHLSYPFIFAHNSSFYMIPEAAQSREVWIYECMEFPGKWEKRFRIMDNKTLYDPTLLYKEGMWYLFATEKINAGSSTDQYLHIYYSKELFSNNWLPHAQNPLTRDDRGSRPAGRIFEQDGKLIRPAQIGAPQYGYGIQFNEITKLSPVTYSEREIDSISPKFRNGIIATHTFNFDTNFAVIDAQGTYD